MNKKAGYSKNFIGQPGACLALEKLCAIHVYKTLTSVLSRRREVGRGKKQCDKNGKKGGGRLAEQKLTC